MEDIEEKQSKVEEKESKQDVESKEVPVNVMQQHDPFVDAKSQDDTSTTSDQTTLNKDEKKTPFKILLPCSSIKIWSWGLSHSKRSPMLWMTHVSAMTRC